MRLFRPDLTSRARMVLPRPGRFPVSENLLLDGLCAVCFGVGTLHFDVMDGMKHKEVPVRCVRSFTLGSVQSRWRQWGARHWKANENSPSTSHSKGRGRAWWEGAWSAMGRRRGWIPYEEVRSWVDCECGSVLLKLSRHRKDANKKKTHCGVTWRTMAWRMLRIPLCLKRCPFCDMYELLYICFVLFFVWGLREMERNNESWQGQIRSFILRK